MEIRFAVSNIIFTRFIKIANRGTPNTFPSANHVYQIPQHAFVANLRWRKARLLRHTTKEKFFVARKVLNNVRAITL